MRVLALAFGPSLWQVTAGLGRWPSPMNCVNEPDGFRAPDTTVMAQAGRRIEQYSACEEWG